MQNRCHSFTACEMERDIGRVIESSLNYLMDHKNMFPLWNATLKICATINATTKCAKTYVPNWEQFWAIHSVTYSIQNFDAPNRICISQNLSTWAEIWCWKCSSTKSWAARLQCADRVTRLGYFWKVLLKN